MARRRTSTGRRRVQIRRIQSEVARQVCFSKRRTGLFNKLSELAIMCGVELAAVVFSPGGNPFTFGHPSVESILERFSPTGPPVAGQGGGRDAGGELAELSRQSGALRAQLDAAEKVLKERQEAAKAKQRAAPSPMAAWLDANVRDLGEAELMAFEAALAGVQVAVVTRANREAQVLQEALNYGHANNNWVQPTPQQFLHNNGHANNNQVQPTAPQQFLHNNGHANNNQVQLQPTAPQQFLHNNGHANNNQVQVHPTAPQQFLHNNGHANNNQVQPTAPQQFLHNNGHAINNQVQPTAPQQFLHNNGHANNNQVQPTPQQLLHNNGAGYDQFGAGSSSSANNGAVSEIQMLVMPPQPGFNGAGLDMMMMEQGLGFPGPY